MTNRNISKYTNFNEQNLNSRFIRHDKHSNQYIQFIHLEFIIKKALIFHLPIRECLSTLKNYLINIKLI